MRKLVLLLVLLLVLASAALGWLLLQAASAWALKPWAKWWAKPDTLGLKYQSLTLTTPATTCSCPRG